MRLNLDPRANRLLAALPNADIERLTPLLEPVELPPGAVLFQPGAPPEHVVFPSTALVSLLHSRHDGTLAEIALVGNEGVVGVSLQAGDGGTPSAAVVEGGGLGFRLTPAALQGELNRPGPVVQVLLRYAQALLAQMAHTVDCGQRHPLPQQLCRRLLQAMDRMPAHRQLLTETMAAELLGVNQRSLDQAARHLHHAGLIRTQMGHIQVLDRPGLERLACGCHAAMAREYEQAMTSATAR
jgi:CRP-like cAMP-binding protein